jgi:hypothetical protein
LLRGLRSPSQSPQFRTSEVGPTRYRCCLASILLFAMVNHISPASGKTYESEIAGVGISQ